MVFVWSLTQVDCDTMAKCHAYIHHLSGDYWVRTVKDATDHARVPTHLILKARFSGYRRITRSMEFPMAAAQAAKIVARSASKRPKHQSDKDDSSGATTTMTTSAAAKDAAAVAAIEACAKRLLDGCIRDYFAGAG